VRLSYAELPPEDARLGTDVYPLLLELRPALTRVAFDALVTEGARQGLTPLVALDADERCVGAALYRVLATSRGRIFFVDDLVTAPESRSTGVGAALFAELERRGRAAGCERVELDSGTGNQAAHRFYHRRRMQEIALHFGKELGPG
jgi:GNAT superfamily N-acetyltransferase